MGKAERIKTQNARVKIAAQRAEARRAKTRRTVLFTGGSVGIEVAIVVTFLVIMLTASPPNSGLASADPAVAQEITSVPVATFNSVRTGTATGLKSTHGQPELTLNEKPELLYMGGEFCPYCAAEPWAIAAAVSRFGTLSGLHFIHSSPTDAYPDTPTLSFYGSRYASKYLAFVPVEWYCEAADTSTPFQHVYLQEATQQAQLFSTYDGSLPFVDIGNQYLVPQTQY
jgi:thiol-disulfide isomerase/thioredoxin